MKTRTANASAPIAFVLSGLCATLLSSPGQSTGYTYDAPGRLTAVIPLVPGVPTIVSSPTTQLLVQNGNAYFSVVAVGAGPLSYQWLSNGVAIGGSTSEVLTITNVTLPQNLVSNGSFETPPVVINYLTYSAGQNIGGWLVETGNVDHCYSVWWASEGLQSLDLNGTVGGTISQDVPTVPGQQYYLRFAVAGDPLGGAAIKNNTVWWNGAVLDTNTFNITGHTATDMGWTNREYLVTATSNSARIRFASLSISAYGPALDNVSLIPVLPPPANYSVIVGNGSGSVTSAVATIEFDTDRNGVADSWERAYFGATGQSFDADSDGDGISNGNEFLDGTNPANAASFRPRLILTATAGGIMTASPAKTSYSLNESVQLTATADSGAMFLGWFGSITNTNFTVNIVMDGTKNINAVFGTTLTSGMNAEGTIIPESTNTYAFAAANGDTLVVRCGELYGSASFAPWVRVYGPGGVLVASANHTSDAYLTYRTTNAGVFSLTVSSANADQTGDYRLHFVQMPASFIVPAGDEGGPLSNGGNHYGTNNLGDEDLWSFTANTGDNLVLRCGELSGTASYYPWVRLYAPNGALLAQDNDPSDAFIAYRATNSGTFTVLVGSAFPGNSGSYRLNLMKIPGEFVVSPGDDGGTLTNGAAYDGVTGLGDEDIWTFTANAGDNLVLRCADLSAGANYYPYVRLYGTDGALLAWDAHQSDSWIAYRTTNSGTFTVLVGSFYVGDTGSYRLRLAKVPGGFVIPPGDEGGVLVNGGNHDGMNDLGDEDIWTFSANAGDSIILRCGDLSGGGYSPYVRLYGTTGALLASDGNPSDSFVAYRATNSGTFTVLVGSYFQGNTGNYRLRLMQIPGAFIVPPGDDGGVLPPQTSYIGTNDLGDEDIWTFMAYKGAGITLSCQRLSGTFNPWIRLYAPRGALLTSAVNASLATILYTPTNNGTFTLLVGSGSQGFSGTYRLSGTNISGGLRLITPGVVGTNLNLSGTGGVSNVLFILDSTTNVAQPATLWTPIWTNRFDALGGFVVTNFYNPSQREQYFRLSVP